MSTLILKLEPIFKITREQFYQICQNNPDLKLERTNQGEMIIMPPTGGETGRKNAKILFQLSLWNEQTQLGEVFDSSTGFSLPNGADRSPDASWLLKSRWEALSIPQRRGFIPLCPDFVIEILSPTDSLKITQAKMQDYINNGCRLGWLINQKQQEVEIYKQGQVREILSRPLTLSGEDVLPNFSLNLSQIWE